MPECPQLRQGRHRFVQELALQSQQVAARNRLHKVEERLARWLLMCQDRIGGDVVPRTQDFLAYAGDATGQRDGGRGNIAESSPDHVFARSGKDSRPQQTGRGLLRRLWNDRAANEEMAG
jgi:hypothetical protein